MLELSEDENVERALSFFLEVFVLYGIFFYWAITETLDSMESSKQLKIFGLFNQSMKNSKRILMS